MNAPSEFAASPEASELRFFSGYVNYGFLNFVELACIIFHYFARMDVVRMLEQYSNQMEATGWAQEKGFAGP